MYVDLKRVTFCTAVLSVALVQHAWIGTSWAQSPVVEDINGEFSPPFLTFTPNTVGWVYEPTTSFELDGIYSTFRAINNPLPATRAVTLSLYDGPPSEGGMLLRSGTFDAGPAGGNLGISFDPLPVAPGEAYFIGYTDVANLGLNIVDFAVSLPSGEPNPDVQFQDGWYTGDDFSTFFAVADSPGFAAPILRMTGVVPEPSGMGALLVGGLALVGAVRRRRPAP